MKRVPNNITVLIPFYVISDVGPPSLVETRFLLYILDDRNNRMAILLTSQFPIADWHDRIPDPTLADAILDRLVHNAHRIQLQGESQRKICAQRTMSSI